MKTQCPSCFFWFPLLPGSPLLFNEPCFQGCESNSGSRTQAWFKVWACYHGLLWPWFMREWYTPLSFLRTSLFWTCGVCVYVFALKDLLPLHRKLSVTIVTGNSADPSPFVTPHGWPSSNDPTEDPPDRPFCQWQRTPRANGKTWHEKAFALEERERHVKRKKQVRHVKTCNGREESERHANTNLLSFHLRSPSVR